jgi:hypothetical protein
MMVRISRILVGEMEKQSAYSCLAGSPDPRPPNWACRRCALRYDALNRSENDKQAESS